MDALQKLQHLSLVQRVIKELNNNVGIKDSTLAEFIIDLAQKSGNQESFSTQLKQNGAAFPDAFIATLYKIIDSMNPKKIMPILTNQVKKDPEALDDIKKERESDEKTKDLIKSEDVSLKKRYRDYSDEEEDYRSLKRVKKENFEEDTKRPPIGARDDYRHYKDEEYDRREGRSYDRRLSDREGEMRGSESRHERSSREDSRRPDRDDGRSRYEREDSRRYDREYGRSRYEREDDRRNDREDGRSRYEREDYRQESSQSHSSQSQSSQSHSSHSHSSKPSSSRSSLDDIPIVHKIYDGLVTNIRDFGCFVSLDGVRGHPEGMVHITEVSNDHINNLSDVIRRKQRVKVKVKTYAGSKIGLSMKEVDQSTGEDLLPHTNLLFDNDSSRRINDEFSSGGRHDSVRQNRRDSSMLGKDRIERALDSKSSGRAKHKVSDHDLFEMEQLYRSGQLKLEDSAFFDKSKNSLIEVDQNDTVSIIDKDIELNDEQPIFLKGHLSHTHLSPVKILANPTGSMSRAALVQSAHAKERREIRDQQRNALIDAIPQDELRILKEDPMNALKANSNDPSNSATFVENLLKQNQASDIPEWKKSAFAGSKLGQIQTKSILEQRQSLPIYQVRDAILQAVHDHHILIIVGETGSGKTTQLTQYLAEAGYTSKGRIGCTQPRRVAATSVAKRVAEEVGCRLGEQVGYSIRFEDVTSPETKIKYMTDGMLLRECLIDPDLKQYSCIILDEAHERSIHTDVLMGLLKQTATRRPDLRLIVTSATLNAEKFSSYFFDAPIFTVRGRTFPVEVLWTRDPEDDYLEAALVTILQIHITEPPGDILVFLTGQEEIDTACQILYERIKNLGPDLPELIILPIYSALPSEMQSRIFEAAPPGSRKVIIGTNIAETSVTIDGIYYVVDPGFVKQKVYNPKTGMDALVVTPVSRAQAEQRKGRAGRTGPGKCYRLYTQTAYETEMLDSPIPELQRTNLASTVLTMKALGINDLLNFDFMDKPAEAQLVTAMHTLYTLGALDDEGVLTRIGRKMAELPLEPQLAKMLLISVELKCSEEILSIVAMLNVQNVFYRPKEKAQIADQKKSKFMQPEGDHLTLLAVYEGWKASRFSNPWCFENFIQARSMKRAQDVRKQLLAMMDRYKLDIVSCGKNYNLVRKAIVAGFFANAAKKDPQEGYKTVVEGTPVYIHPSSAMFQRNPDWVVYHELVQTTKEYMREVTVVEPAWLVEFAPKFFKMSDPNAMTKRKKKERLDPLYDKWRDPNEWRISRRKG